MRLEKSIKLLYNYCDILKEVNMKTIIYYILSAAAIILTVYIISLNELTTNSGAISKTGIEHHLLFVFWGVSVYAALYADVFSLASLFGAKKHFLYVLALSSFIGMALTLVFKFDSALKLQYYLHCTGSLVFSVCTGLAVFLTFLSGAKKKLFNLISTVIIAAALVSDLVLLLIFKQNALIEGLPVIFALLIMPITISINGSNKSERKTADASR